METPQVTSKSHYRVIPTVKDPILQNNLPEFPFISLRLVLGRVIIDLLLP